MNRNDRHTLQEDLRMLYPFRYARLAFHVMPIRQWGDPTHSLISSFLLQVVYDCGPVPGHSWEDFDSLRDRVAQQWAELPPAADNYSASLKAKVERLRQDMHGLKAARAEASAAGRAAAAAAAGASSSPAAAKA
jgi:hypothetical protein